MTDLTVFQTKKFPYVQRLGNELAACYRQVRDVEIIKNAAWKAKLQKDN